MDPALALEASAKAVLYASVLVVIGASATRWLLLPRVAAEIGVDSVVAIEQSVARLALLAAILAFAALGLRVWTHAVSAFGFDGAHLWATLELIAFRSRWGYGWRLQAIAAFVLVLASLATAWRRTAWPLATLAAVVFTATIPLLGHASGSAARMTLHTVHILAGGVWLGTLAVVLVMRLPPLGLPSVETSLVRERSRLLILRCFSSIALSSSATVVVAGAVAAWLYVGALADVWTAAYGRVLVLKAGLVGGVSICGYANWRSLRSVPRDDRSSASLIALEVTLAIAVVIVTGLLTEIGHP